MLSSRLSAALVVCLFATSTPPEGWFRWSSILVAADVTEVGKEEGKPVDVITARVVEKVERPALGARLLVALSPSSDAMLVPLSSALADGLRAQKAKEAK